MSVGNATQAIDFDRKDLTLVLGENLDLGGDGSRNGTGKTTIINALSYALYGNALSNIRKDNLVNKTNGKNMLVSLDFIVAGKEYRIERGRKPNVLKFYVNNEEQAASDYAQGDSRETQDAIETTMGLSHDMFKHIMALNTYTEPFLSLKANDQRTLIEQLLGITMLSERADRIKELNKATKDSITQEEFRIRAVVEANKRIEEQIDNLKRRKGLWFSKHEEDLSKLKTAIQSLKAIDIEAEIQAHRDHAQWDQKRKDFNDLQSALSRAKLERDREDKQIKKLEAEITTLESHTCHTCGQAFHDNKHQQVLEGKQKDLATAREASQQHSITVSEIQAALNELGEIGKPPKMFYDDEHAAVEHRANLAALEKQLESKQVETDPYTEQIEEMSGQALQEVNYDALNNLTRLQEHQEFLLKLLTSKDSFIRKKIIEQNLSYLNSRLTHYLDRIGLPHTVVFQNDLTVSIEELGRELDFDNLSRGERNRLILSMSWAFRDVWESLYEPINVLFIDEMIDNGMDTQGVENSLALLKKMSRERHKSIWLVSHKDELAGRVENILKVVKENGFTSYNTDIEIV
ncbi:endonuclease subunit [uncultured Caudovirales phage]|uniref:Endonuclease subunit n=1 Tax=uncultured Caudovirales phage TaxID=2100421 RepID=A0A6J5LTZ5_9CAUD|nr:endonuclease subunit [uncultured Caudovirales phage]